MSDFEDGDPGEQRNQRLPPEVYRRRRIVAALIALVVIGLVVWGVVFAVQRISASVGGAAEPSATETENNNFESFSARPTPSGNETAGPSGSASATASGSATADPSGSADPSASEGGGESADPSGSAEPSQSPGESGDPSPSAQAAGEVSACGDSLSVATSVNQESYAPGQAPVITATVVNDSENPCSVDPAADVHYVITSGPAEVYDSQACGAAPEGGQQTLEPGAEARQDSTWNRGMTAYGCGDAATPAEPGYYWVTASVGGVQSEPQLIRIEG